MLYKVLDKIDKEVIIARKGKDKIWKVGYNPDYGGTMIQLEVRGKRADVQPLLAVLKWLDESWVFEPGVLG